MCNNSVEKLFTMCPSVSPLMILSVGLHSGDIAALLILSELGVNYIITNSTDYKNYKNKML